MLKELKLIDVYKKVVIKNPVVYPGGKVKRRFIAVLEKNIWRRTLKAFCPEWNFPQRRTVFPHKDISNNWITLLDI